VINLAVSEALYARHPDDDEGILSARRAAIVSATGLAVLAAGSTLWLSRTWRG
jgi:dsRNA-specific ribonuclease